MELKPHQVEGVRELLGGKSLLADDMGTGKTLQALTVAKAIGGKILVICPGVVKENWAQEACQVGFQRPWVINGRTTVLDAWGADLGIINYEVLPAWGSYFENFVGTWDLLVLDEAHRVCNPETQAYQTIHDLRRKRMIALTGTPILNRVEELSVLLGLLEPHTDLTYRELLKKHMVRRTGIVQLPPLTRILVENVGDKFRWLRKHVSANPGSKRIIFTLHRACSNQVLADLSGYKNLLMDGRTANKQIISDLWKTGNYDNLVCQMVAGGVGWNGTTAQEVIFMELPWNPAGLWQCEGRIKRIGQTKPMKSYVLVGVQEARRGWRPGDDRMYKMLQRKTKIFDRIIGCSPGNGFKGFWASILGAMFPDS